jgi:hypothetical protein
MALIISGCSLDNSQEIAATDITEIRITTLTLSMILINSREKEKKHGVRHKT